MTSACAGEGALALARAFLAGGGTVVASIAMALDDEEPEDEADEDDEEEDDEEGGKGKGKRKAKGKDSTVGGGGGGAFGGGDGQSIYCESCHKHHSTATAHSVFTQCQRCTWGNPVKNGDCFFSCVANVLLARCADEGLALGDNDELELKTFLRESCAMEMGQEQLDFYLDTAGSEAEFPGYENFLNDEMWNALQEKRSRDDSARTRSTAESTPSESQPTPREPRVASVEALQHLAAKDGVLWADSHSQNIIAEKMNACILFVDMENKRGCGASDRYRVLATSPDVEWILVLKLSGGHFYYFRYKSNDDTVRGLFKLNEFPKVLRPLFRNLLPKATGGLTATECLENLGFNNRVAKGLGAGHPPGGGSADAEQGANNGFDTDDEPLVKYAASTTKAKEKNAAKKRGSSELEPALEENAAKKRGSSELEPALEDTPVKKSEGKKRKLKGKKQDPAAAEQPAKAEQPHELVDAEEEALREAEAASTRSCACAKVQKWTTQCQKYEDNRRRLVEVARATRMKLSVLSERVAFLLRKDQLDQVQSKCRTPHTLHQAYYVYAGKTTLTRPHSHHPFVSSSTR
mmetsp:Transcript_88784/g.253765  ORF Transcript_88784/g.253765 Transcript_88784/m.253765 type:complete len:577 (+) Transcript_88784:149-1879(+)